MLGSESTIQFQAKRLEFPKETCRKGENPALLAMAGNRYNYAAVDCFGRLFTLGEK